MRPARIFSSVDLPEPLGPTRPAWSPSNNPNDRLSKSDRAAYDLLTVSQLSRSGRAIRAYFFFLGFFFSFRMPVPFAMSSPPLTERTRNGLPKHHPINDANIINVRCRNHEPPAMRLRAAPNLHGSGEGGPSCVTPA